MRSVTSEMLLEFVLLGVYTVLAAVLTVAGVFVEYLSVQHFGSGELTVALWLAAMGAIMLYAGLYGKLVSREPGRSERGDRFGHTGQKITDSTASDTELMKISARRTTRTGVTPVCRSWARRISVPRPTNASMNSQL